MMSEDGQKNDPAMVLGPILLAQAVFWSSYAIANVLAKLALGLWWYSLPVWTAAHLAFGFGCMALARFCCDRVFRTYSGRGPFVLFLCVGVVVMAWYFASEPLGTGLLLDLAVQLFIVVSAYWWFWRGRPLNKADPSKINTL